MKGRQGGPAAGAAAEPAKAQCWSRRRRHRQPEVRGQAEQSLCLLSTAIFIRFFPKVLAFLRFFGGWTLLLVK